MVDFVNAGIGSSLFYQYLNAGAADSPQVATPQVFDQVRQVNNPDFASVDHEAQRSAVATVTPKTSPSCSPAPLNGDGTKPAAPLAKRTRICLAAGCTLPIAEDNVT